MKTILVDAVECFVSETGEMFQEMYSLLETYPNKKILVTGAPHEKFAEYGLNKVPYEVFTLQQNPRKTDPAYFIKLLDTFSLGKDDVVYFEHNPEAVESAQSIGVISYHYDEQKKDLEALADFLDSNLQ